MTEALRDGYDIHFIHRNGMSNRPWPECTWGVPSTTKNSRDDGDTGRKEARRRTEKGRCKAEDGAQKETRGMETCPSTYKCGHLSIATGASIYRCVYRFMDADVSIYRC